MADETTEDYDVKACARGALSDNEWRRCVEIIAAGGAVAVNGARLRAATTIVLARNGSDIVGVGTIKGIRKAYAAGIAGPEKSGYAFPPETPELGYVAVDLEHQRQHATSLGAVESTIERRAGIPGQEHLPAALP